jgi:hypothetical protein
MAASPSGTLDLTPNQLVTRLGKEAPDVVPATKRVTALTGLEAAAFTASESPESRYFAGYLGATFTARNEDWCVLYLDLALRTWLLIQKSGVLNREQSAQEPGTPAQLDVLWVKADAAVSSGSDALSLEGLFLIGDFTRAGDFDVEALAGGTLAAGSGGYGLAGQSPPRCCNRTVRRP